MQKHNHIYSPPIRWAVQLCWSYRPCRRRRRHRVVLVFFFLHHILQDRDKLIKHISKRQRPRERELERRIFHLIDVFVLVFQYVINVVRLRVCHANIKQDAWCTKIVWLVLIIWAKCAHASLYFKLGYTWILSYILQSVCAFFSLFFISLLVDSFVLPLHFWSN